MPEPTRRRPLVSSSAQALGNIRRFAAELQRSPQLQSRLRQFRAWYALRNEDGSWLVAPSKFIGYRDNTAENYLKTYKHNAAGGETEEKLRQWFEEVDADSRLGREIGAVLDEFLSKWGKARNKAARINLTTEMLDENPAVVREEKRDHRLLERITSDPRICGGRPCIRGTRMRVADIVDLLAYGAGHEEVLADYPFLEQEDIAAALLYAARATDHRVVSAA